MVYYMQAICKSDTIDLSFIKAGVTVDKDMVALIVVFGDIAASYLFFLSLFFLRIFQKVANNEIDHEVVTASDFAVEITNLP